MLTLFCSIGDLFETSKTYSEKEQVGEKIEQPVLGLIKPDNDKHLRCLLFFHTVVRMLISKSVIYPDCTSVEAPQL